MWNALSTNEKMQHWVKRCHEGVKWSTFVFVEPPLISRVWMKLETSYLAQRCTAVSTNDPLISPEWLKIETSNLAQRLIGVSTNETMQNWVKRGHVGVTWSTFGILDPPNISGIAKARIFKFSQRNAWQRVLTRKLGQKGSRWGHVTHFLEFWDPPNISGTVKVRNVKFGTYMRVREY